jgi:hypothetical protein
MSKIHLTKLAGSKFHRMRQELLSKSCRIILHSSQNLNIPPLITSAVACPISRLQLRRRRIMPLTQLRWPGKKQKKQVLTSMPLTRRKLAKPSTRMLHTQRSRLQPRLVEFKPAIMTGHFQQKRKRKQARLTICSQPSEDLSSRRFRPTLPQSPEVAPGWLSQTRSTKQS